jgi:uncharacterized membrane protein
MDKLLKKIIWVIIAVPAIYLALVWHRIPEIIPLHYNLKGEADRHGSKTELLVTGAILTAICIGMYLLISNIYRIDSRKYAAENRNRFQRIGFSVAVFLSAIHCIIIYTSYHENSGSTTRLILAALGLLFCIMGNYMYNIKPNYFAGIRLPWTLENKENWKKTHLLAGKLFFAGGLMVTAICFTIPVDELYAVFAIIIFIISIIPCIYSFLLYKKNKNAGTLTR